MIRPGPFLSPDRRDLPLLRNPTNLSGVFWRENLRFISERVDEREYIGYINKDIKYRIVPNRLELPDAARAFKTLK